MLAGNAVDNPPCFFIMNGERVKIIGIVGIPAAFVPPICAYGDDIGPSHEEIPGIHAVTLVNGVISEILRALLTADNPATVVVQFCICVVSVNLFDEVFRHKLICLGVITCLHAVIAPLRPCLHAFHHAVKGGFGVARWICGFRNILCRTVNIGCPELSRRSFRLAGILGAG